MADNSSDWMGFAQRSREDGGLGLQPHQAAGLVGNLQNESGADIPSWGPTGDNGSAWGTAQWRGDRLENLKAHAAENGLDYKTVEAQQAFMRHEFDGSENRSYKALQAATTPEEAATAVNTQYERSADRSGNRERSARQLFDGTDGPTAIEQAMGRKPATGSQMAYADDTQPALSPQAPPGALQNGGQPVTADKYAWLQTLGQTLKDMAPGIAQDPAHAQVLEAAAAASRPVKAAAGTWSQSIDPKTGVGTMLHSTTGQRMTFQAHAAQDPEPKWVVTGYDAAGHPVHGPQPTTAELAAQNTPEALAKAAEATAAAERTSGLSGNEFMDDLTTRKGSGYANQIRQMLNGEAPGLTGKALASPKGQEIMNDAYQADPNYRTGDAMSRVKVRNEFKAGGNSTPAGQILAGNTAIKHAGEMSDSLEQYKKDLGDHEGIPGISYGLNVARNAAAKGTQSGSALGDFKVARDHFAEEAAKFYSGTGGSEAERQRAISNLDEAKSLPELRSVIRKETALMQEKVNGLQERWRTGMGPMVPDFPLINPTSQAAIDRVVKRHESGAVSKQDDKRPSLGDIFK